MVRYLLAPDQVGPAGETLTDVTGVLEQWVVPTETADGRATVRRSSGERVTVPFAVIVAGKVIPPAERRPRRQMYRQQD